MSNRVKVEFLRHWNVFAELNGGGKKNSLTHMILNFACDGDPTRAGIKAAVKKIMDALSTLQDDGIGEGVYLLEYDRKDKGISAQNIKMECLWQPSKEL